MLKDADTLMAMDDVYLLTYQYLSYEGQGIEEREESYIPIHNWEMRNIVNLHSIRHISHSTPIALKFVSNKSDFVASFNQTLT